jgi:preprotein translocase subunit Sec61beta
LRDIEEGYATHGLSRRAVMVDEKEDILPNDDLQYGRYELERDLLQSRGLSVEEMDKGFEDARQAGLISYFKSYYDIPEITPESAYQVSDAVAKGDFTNGMGPAFR